MRSLRASAQAMKWIRSVLQWLKGISAQLWSILINMLTPKERKISGKVGTGVLGLIDVGVEITFGDGNRPGKTVS